MTKIRALTIATFSFVAALGAARSASADVNTSFRKAYTGSAGGDSRFGAGYSLEYGYGASKNGANAKVNADARTGAWVKLFNKTFDAVSLKANATGAVSASNPPCTAKLAYETFLVGIKIPTASGSFSGGKFLNKNIVSRSQRLTPKASIDLVRIGPAVLGLEAYASATEYIRINGSAWCHSISAELRPGANLTAVANFRADAVIAAAGLRGTLTLMDVSVPANATAGFSWRKENDFFGNGSFCSWNATTSASAKVDIVPVSGKFEPWVRVGLPCTDIFGLLPGRGICLSKEWSHTLWSASYGTTSHPLAGSGTAHFIGTGTTSCPANPPSAPTR